MKASFLLIALMVVLGCFSCRQAGLETEPEPLKPNEPTLAEQAENYAKTHPDIAPPALNNAQPSSVKVAIDQLFVGTYSFKYGSNNELLHIVTGNDTIFQERTDRTTKTAFSKVSGETTTFQLNAEGLAQSSKGTTASTPKREVNTRYFYKNGFLVSMANETKLTKFEYNGQGNLLSWSGVNHQGLTTNASYEYTDIPNTIRQEITSWITPHFSMRGDFLGKYSSRLLKKMTVNTTSGISSGNNNILEFTYTFDGNGRISRMTIQRSDGTKVFYEYQY